jgi:hypothetical protein
LKPESQQNWFSPAFPVLNLAVETSLTIHSRAMVDADVSREIPFTPVRSSSDTSGLASSYSEASVPNDSSVASGVASGKVPPSPQRSYQNSASSSPSSVNRSVANLSPAPVRTPAKATPMQPDLQSPQFGEPQVGDLLGDYSEQRPHFTPQPRQGKPRVLYASDDEDTDPTSSTTVNGSDYPAYTRSDATSTFGRVIQPFKVSRTMSGTWSFSNSPLSRSTYDLTVS